VKHGFVMPPQIIKDRHETIFLNLCLSLMLGLGLTLALLGVMNYLGASSLAYAASPRYVASNGSDNSNDCTDSANPCATIQHAVDVAAPGDEIKVVGGTYTGVSSRLSQGFGNTVVVTQMIYLSKSVSIQGGYDTLFSEPPQPTVYLTILDAQGQGRVFYIMGPPPQFKG
jgi:hypothetical protein